MALVAVATCANSFEAGIAGSRLDADGIPCVLFDSNASMDEAEGAPDGRLAQAPSAG